MATEKPKRHKSPGIDEIPSELIKARGITIRSQIHKLINSIWNKEELPAEWKVSIIVLICKKADIIDCSNYRGVFGPKRDEVTGEWRKLQWSVLLTQYCAGGRTEKNEIGGACGA